MRVHPVPGRRGVQPLPTTAPEDEGLVIGATLHAVTGRGVAVLDVLQVRRRQPDPGIPVEVYDQATVLDRDDRPDVPVGYSTLAALCRRLPALDPVAGLKVAELVADDRAAQPALGFHDLPCLMVQCPQVLVGPDDHLRLGRVVAGLL